MNRPSHKGNIMEDAEKFTQDEVNDGASLGPAYVRSRNIVDGFIASFESEMFKPMCKKWADEFYTEIVQRIDDYVLSDLESNLQLSMYHQVDATVEALLSGEPWALVRYVTGKTAHNGAVIRAAIARQIPREVQDIRIADLELQLETLKQEVAFLRRLTR